MLHRLIQGLKGPIGIPHQGQGLGEIDIVDFPSRRRHSQELRLSPKVGLGATFSKSGQQLRIAGFRLNTMLNHLLCFRQGLRDPALRFVGQAKATSGTFKVRIVEERFLNDMYSTVDIAGPHARHRTIRIHLPIDWIQSMGQFQLFDGLRVPARERQIKSPPMADERILRLGRDGAPERCFSRDPVLFVPELHIGLNGHRFTILRIDRQRPSREFPRLRQGLGSRP